MKRLLVCSEPHCTLKTSRDLPEQQVFTPNASSFSEKFPCSNLKDFIHKKQKKLRDIIETAETKAVFVIISSPCQTRPPPSLL